MKIIKHDLFNLPNDQFFQKLGQTNSVKNSWREFDITMPNETVFLQAKSNKI